MVDAQHLTAVAVYSLIGIGVFALVWILIVKISPFSMKKEILEDQNTSLAIVLGAVILGLAHIIAATISG